MVSYICIVLYHLFYTVLACMISLNLHDCPFLSQVMDEEIGPGLTQGHRAGPGSTEGELLAESKCHPRYCVLCRAWEHFSCHMVAKVRPVTEVHRVAEPNSYISVLPVAQVTSTERNAVLDSHPILTLLLHTLHPLRRISYQIISFLNVQASDINALFRAITRGALA